MILTINEKEYKLPEYLNIENYVKLFNVKDIFDDDYFEIKLINSLTGVKYDEILNLPHNKIKTVSNYIMGILPSTNFQFVDRFKLNNIEYGFIPEYKNMSFAEFVDLDTLLTKKPEEIMNNLHIIASIMFRPIVSQKSVHNYKIETYDPSTIEERAQLFKNELDVKYVLGGKFFFSKSVKEYSQPSRQSLIQRWKIWMKSIKLTWKILKMNRLKRRSDGLPSSIESVETILRNTK